MKIITLLIGLMKLLGLFFNKAMERDAARKKVMEETYNDIKKSIKQRDASALTRGLNKLNGL